MAIFCAFGTEAEDPLTRSAIDAAQAALELRTLFKAIADQWQMVWAREGCSSRIGLGCGLHTGHSLVGSLGIESHNQFTAIGPHVNFASRLESRAESGQILLSEATRERLPSTFEVTSLAVARNIKNIPGEYAIYKLDGRRPG